MTIIKFIQESVEALGAETEYWLKMTTCKRSCRFSKLVVNIVVGYCGKNFELTVFSGIFPRLAIMGFRIKLQFFTYWRDRILLQSTILAW